MPLKTADHAASPAPGSLEFAATLTDNWPREALSLKAVVNTSNNSRSCTGALLAASTGLAEFPVHIAQVFVPTPTSFKTFVALRYTVCHGVPRCTRPSQPTV